MASHCRASATAWVGSGAKAVADALRTTGGKRSITSSAWRGWIGVAWPAPVSPNIRAVTSATGMRRKGLNMTSRITMSA